MTCGSIVLIAGCLCLAEPGPVLDADDPRAEAPADSAIGGIDAPAPAALQPSAPKPESVGSLLAGEGSGRRGTGPQETPTLAGGGAGGILFRMLGWMAAVAVAAIVLVKVWKRLVPSAAPGGPAGGIRVVGRAALTPRHSLYTVRVGNHRMLVVGVSGDRMTALTQFDDPAQVVALDGSFQKTLEGAPPPGEDGSLAPPVPEGDLSLYRREVGRLRERVRLWRWRLGRESAVDLETSGRRPG